MTLMRYLPLALALAIAPATAFATQETGGTGLAFTAGYGAIDGGASPIAHIDVAMPTPQSHIESDNDDNVWAASLSFFFNDHWAIDGWIAQGAKHSTEIDVDPGNDVPVAHFTTAPIAFTAQYHFAPLGRFKPFIGAGWHWTRVSDLGTNDAVTEIAGLNLGNDNGMTAVAGFDIAISDGWFARGEARWMDWSTEATIDADVPAKSTNMDTTFYGVSIGYRF
jgi:outer membrane protein